jgi:hypothetical protein
VLGNTQGAHVFQSFSATLGDIETTKEKLPPSATKEKLHDNMENVFMRILQRTVKGNGCEQIKYIIKNQSMCMNLIFHISNVFGLKKFAIALSVCRVITH